MLVFVSRLQEKQDHRQKLVLSFSRWQARQAKSAGDVKAHRSMWGQTIAVPNSSNPPSRLV